MPESSLYSHMRKILSLFLAGVVCSAAFLAPPWNVSAQLAAPLSVSMDACTREGFAADPPLFANCTTCHNDLQTNSGDGLFELQNVPLTWTPGTTYTIAAILQDSGQARWGFRVTVLDENGVEAGILTPADANTENCLFSGREYLKHTPGGSRPGFPDGPVDFVFDWTAPAAGTGRAEFYAVGLACNWDSSRFGDYTYTQAAVVLEDASSGTGISLLAQPDHASPSPGENLTIRFRMGNHTAQLENPFFVSRLRLPNGQLYPSTGWLEGPTQQSLSALGRQDFDVVHAIPSTAPIVGGIYESWLAVDAMTILAADSFDLQIVP